MPGTHLKIEKHLFGSTDMQTYPLGFGGHELDGVPPEQASRLLNGALDSGLNVIDTAECYGESEELIGHSVGKRRSDYYLFTKCGHVDDGNLGDWLPSTIEMNIERSLKRLRTDYLDLLQLHSCPWQYIQRGDIIEVLQRARQAGKVRYIGYSGDRHNALYAVRSGHFDVLQTTVNIADQEAIDLVIPEARARGMAVIAKRPMANAAWKATSLEQDVVRSNYHARLDTLNYEFLSYGEDIAANIALRFVLSVPGIDVAIVGTSRPERYQSNLTMLREGPLPDAQFTTIRDRWQTATRWRKWLPGSTLGWHAHN